MRVAIFTDNDFGKINGVTTTLKAVLQYAGGQASPRVYTAAEVGTETGDYFAAASFGVGLPWYREMRIYWPRVRRILDELGRHPVDVIHLTTPGPVGLAGRRLASRLGVPIVGSYHTHLGEYARMLSGTRRMGDWLDTYMRWFYAPCASMLVPSRATARLLASQGYAGERLRIWPRGVDTRQFAATRRSESLRRKWRVDGRRPAVLYAGRLSAEKGLAILPRVRQLLHRRAIEHQFVFVGDGPMAESLRRDIPDGVFLGAVPHHDVATVMASADVFVFPSTTDSFGNVVLEAQASGLPTIVTDRGGPAEHVRDGETGFICPADPSVFADALTCLLHHEPKRRAMGAAARVWAERYDWRDAIQPVLSAWRDAAGTPAAEPVETPRAGEAGDRRRSA